MPFSNLEPKPIDPILLVFGQYLEDPNPNKVNLSIGMYFDEQGQLSMYNACREANLALAKQNKPKSYLPIEGDNSFLASVRELVFGEQHPAVVQQRIASVQTIASTGGLRICADFFKQYVGSKRIWMSNPTWSNHIDIYKLVGFDVKEYSYYDAAQHTVAFEQLCAELDAGLQAHDLVLLHPCCHNPTGADFTEAQWDTLLALLAKHQAFPLFDMAYLGFARGLAEDAYPIRKANDFCKNYGLIFSGSKSFGLYGERVGCVNLVCDSQEQAEIVQSNLKQLIRRSYSSPIAHGAALVDYVLRTPEINATWQQELASYRDRINGNRALLADKLAALGVDFNYIKEQYGFFSFLDITPAQALRLRSEYGIYVLESGRVNFAGITQSNVDYIAQAIANVVKG